MESQVLMVRRFNIQDIRSTSRVIRKQKSAETGLSLTNPAPEMECFSDGSSDTRGIFLPPSAIFIHLWDAHLICQCQS